MHTCSLGWVAGQGFRWTAIGYFGIDFRGIHPFRRTRVAGTRLAADGPPSNQPPAILAGWPWIPIGAIHIAPRAPSVQINRSAASPHKQQAAVTSIGSRVRLAWRFLPRAALPTRMPSGSRLLNRQMKKGAARTAPHPERGIFETSPKIPRSTRPVAISLIGRPQLLCCEPFRPRPSCQAVVERMAALSIAEPDDFNANLKEKSCFLFLFPCQGPSNRFPRPIWIRPGLPGPWPGL